MDPIDHIRRTHLEAPRCTFLCGDPVYFRRTPASREEHGRVIARTFGPVPTYDIETADGGIARGITIARLDEPLLRTARAAAALETEHAGP